MSELLDWVEKAALENLRFRLQNTETLAKEAAATLTVLLAGMWAALAYAVKVFESGGGSVLAWGAAALSAWLMLCGMLLVWKCLMTQNLSIPTNEPKNLLQKQYALDALREAELLNIQGRIDQAAQRNHYVAAWLDRCRWMLLLSPVAFVIAALAVAAR